MTDTRTLAVLAIVAPALLGGCEDPQPSSSIPTHRLYADFVAEVDAAGSATMTGDYRKDNGTFVDADVYLDGGDTVTFRAHEQSLTLPGGTNHFLAHLVSGIAEDTLFQFDLQRPEHADAPDSWGTLPEPMDVLMPEPDAEYSHARDELVVAWSPAGTIDDMWIRLAQRCVETTSGAAPHEVRTMRDVPGDPGAFAIDLSSLGFASSCRRYALTVTLVRARDGELDPAYAPDENECGDDCPILGSVSVRQVRAVDVALVP